MKFDDNYYGHWKTHSECKCTLDKKIVINIRWIEVPMTDGTTEGWLNFGRTVIRLATAGISELATGSNGNITHEAIECQYHCSECGSTGYYTFDYSNTGKRARCGAYQTKSNCVASQVGERSLYQIKNIWSTTWPNDNKHTYSILYHNCKGFAKAMWTNI